MFELARVRVIGGIFNADQHQGKQQSVRVSEVVEISRFNCISKLTYMCGSVLFEYLGTGNDKDEKYLKSIYVRENISCSSKIELTYYSVDYFQKICIHCGD